MSALRLGRSKLLPYMLIVGAFPAFAADRPSESDMFGAEEEAIDAGAVDAGVPAADAGPAVAEVQNQDTEQLNGAPSKNKFDTEEVKTDPLKIGGSLFMQGQVFAREGAKFTDDAFSAPTVLETFLDARPNDRVRAFALGRVTWDPTRPVGAASTSSTGGASTIGLTSVSGNNPNVQLDQLWLRFDILQKVYLTVGRQKVRWGVSRVWYPTDFLNSQPRDAFNPFDARLGVNMVKVHVPIESLGWNFYAYGLMDNLEAGATGLTVGRLGGALRAEFLLGPAEVTASGVWMAGRRPRYAVDASAPLGPFDVYAEVAFRDARDFILYSMPSDVSVDNIVSKWFAGDVKPYRPEGYTAQASGGASLTINYTEKNTLLLTAEYFFNPMGYSSTAGYLAQTFLPSLDGSVLDPAQKVPLYQGKHNLAVTVAAPGLPNFSWITLSLTNILNLTDPAGLVRFDAIFRVLTYLNVQAFASVFYGQPGGELRFQIPSSLGDQVAPFLPSDQVKTFRQSIATVSTPPLMQAGLLLRLSI